MKTEEHIRAVFANALQAHEAAAVAKRALEAVMLEAMQKLLPEGHVMDLRFGRGEPIPCHLVSVHTMKGNDRGTRVFRIARVYGVEANPRSPDLSTWKAEAVPISEKTGKDMSASSGHRGRASDVVCLYGRVGYERTIDEPVETTEQRVIELVVQQLAAANSQRT